MSVIGRSHYTLQWRHNGRDGVSNHQPHDCLLNRLFSRRSKETSKLRGTGLCAMNSPVTGEFLAPMASNAENVSIWWRHHAPLVTNGKVNLRSLSNPHSCTLSIIQTFYSCLYHYIILLEQRFWLLYSPCLDNSGVWIMASNQEPPIGWPHPFMGLLPDT